MSRFVIALDASQLNEYLTCPRMWYWRYHRGLALSGLKRKALDKGTVIHQLCDLYYNLRAMDPRVPSLTHCQAVLELFTKQKITLGLSAEELEFLKMRFFQYCVRYSAADFMPIAKRGVPAVELGFSKVLRDTPDYLYVVEGRIDLIGTYAQTEMFIDHKTQEQSKDLYQFSPQFLTYAWATGITRGMINYIGLQKEMTEKSFRRQLIYFPPWKIKEWENQMVHIFDSIRIDFETSEDWLKRTPYAMNQHSCGGAFGSAPCMFTRLCETADERLKESIANQYYEIKRWKPWEVEKTDE